MWFWEARGLTWRSQVGANPIPISTYPTNLALLRRKITLYRFNQGAHTIAGGSNGSRGLSPPSPPHFNHWSSPPRQQLYRLVTGWRLNAHCQWRRKQFTSGGTMPARPAENFLMCPHFSLVPATWGEQRLFVTDWETKLKCRLVSALQSAHLLVKSGEVQYTSTCSKTEHRLSQFLQRRPRAASIHYRKSKKKT